MPSSMGKTAPQDRHCMCWPCKVSSSPQAGQAKTSRDSVIVEEFIGVPFLGDLSAIIADFLRHQRRKFPRPLRGKMYRINKVGAFKIGNSRVDILCSN